MSDADVESVKAYRRLVNDLLAKAAEVKPENQIEPPLTEADLGGSIWRIPRPEGDTETEQKQQANFAAVETAFREKFYELLATTSIDDPAFTNIWNLLDIVSIFSDNEQCEPGLIFWLIEELLDSQTIDGCRKVFDYLESRREINTAKHFKQKSLIILRSCNELLRRLSRAEDTVFCGRVFIYMFQSFPLGDKSSVNLRGEFHTENVTTFDEIPKKPKDEEMETDTPGATEAPADQQPADSQKPDSDSQPKEELPKPPEVVVSDKKDAEKEKRVDLDALYPIFWGLQAYFSSPTKLFDPQHFASFRSGLEATLSTFKLINTDLDTRSAAKTPDEVRRGVKRKRTGDGVDTFNPKYLTSRELFDLEVNDIAFRRHVLVQALILLDFILSLTPKARSRLPKSINRAVVYNYVVSEEDAKWATETREAIAEYLQQGLEGKFYYRMVDTVLSRDKNWVRWKVENCPPIERPAVSVEDYLDARENALKVFSSKRLRPSPMGSLDLKFLSDGENIASLERLKEPDRFSTPAPDSYMMGIVDDDFDIDMAKTKEEKDDAMRAKASKVWRTLRLTARSKLALFDKIEDGNNIKVLFESPQPPEEAKKASTEVDKTPQNTESQDEKERPAESQEEVRESTSQEAEQQAEQPPTETTAS
ncbi:hypothetical protein VTN77DRAFT_9345 [Rasamsonia byssochlamydoides]|uniref:uncharacterized protein n=1 Tax=Rasamsonia byssochlamydoides TaxID=89139 RepID=UPI0037428054